MYLTVHMICVGAEHIRDLLKVTYSLKSLDMSHNSVGDDGISVILKELQHNNILTRFAIENCGLSEEGIFASKINKQ